MPRLPTMLLFAVLVSWRGAAHAAAPPDGQIRASEPDPGARWELTASLTGELSSSRLDEPGQLVAGMGGAFVPPPMPLPQPDVTQWTAAAGGQATGYLSRLRDDGSPYSLQPFLQRASTFTVDVSAAHSSAHFTSLSGLTNETSWAGNVGGGVHLYVKPWFILLASIDYAYVQLLEGPEDQRQQRFNGTAGLGLRKGDTSLELSYTQAAQRAFGAFAPLQRGPVLLTLTTVANRRLLGSLTAEAIRGGGAGALAGAYFPKPRLGLMGSALASHGALGNDASTVTRYVGTVGISAWRTSSAGVSAQYSFTAERIVVPQPGSAQVPTNVATEETIHALVLQAFVRLR